MRWSPTVTIAARKAHARSRRRLVSATGRQHTEPAALVPSPPRYRFPFFVVRSTPIPPQRSCNAFNFRSLPKEDLMNLTISGHHLEVTPALREYVLTKLDRVTRHFDQVVDITVLLTVEKQKEKERRQKAEVTLHVKGRDIYVEHASEDLYAAIDTLMDKLDRQVMRHKDRVQNHHHDSPKRVDASV
jgi:putative sigma-54 modulation protein